jgi:thioredoxin 1
MKNPMIAFVVVAVVAVLGIGAYTRSQSSSQSDSMMKKDEAMMPSENTAMEKIDDAMMKKDDSAMEDKKMMNDDKMMQKSDPYVEYSKANLDEAASNRRVLFFYASWCPTCKPTDADLRANSSKIPADVTVVRVNYNDPETDQEEKDLAKKYGITYQHTFVQIDNTGKEVTKWNGGKTDELLAKIK